MKRTTWTATLRALRVFGTGDPRRLCVFMRKFKTASGLTRVTYALYGADACELSRELHGTEDMVRRPKVEKTKETAPTLMLQPDTLKTVMKVSLEKLRRPIVVLQMSGDEWHEAASADASSTVAELEDAVSALTVDQSSEGTTRWRLFLRVRFVRNRREISAAAVDMTTFQLTYASFVDKAAFTSLECLLCALNVKEVTFCTLGNDVSDADEATLTALFKKAGVASEVADLSAFKQTSASLQPLLLPLLRPASAAQLTTSPLLKMTGCVGCMHALLTDCKLGDDEKLAKRFALLRTTPDDMMRLDMAALRALHLLPEQAGNTARQHSLLGFLDRCCTKMGTRLLECWIRQPCVDLEEIQLRHSLVQELSQNDVMCDDDHGGSEALDDIRSALQNCADLAAVCNRFVRGRAKLKDVVQVYHTVTALPSVLTATESSELLRKHLGAPLHELLGPLKKLEQLVKSAVDLGAVERGLVRLKPAFDKELKRLAKERESAEQELQQEHENVKEQISSKVALVRQSDAPGGYAFRVPASARSSVDFDEYQELKRLKSNTLFTCETLIELATALQEIDAEYREREKEFVRKVIKVASTFVPPLQQLQQLLARVDVLCAFASVVALSSAKLVRPKMLPLGSGQISMCQLRHPLVEEQARLNGEAAFIANDVDMRVNCDGTLETSNRPVQIVTGPNAGGKSTYIRSIGLACVMACIGAFVPASDATISVVDAIFCRVGAGDAQLKNVSTFMMEMLEAANIIAGATSQSLVVIDELGRGTSSFDGFGLAWALCEHLAQRRVLTTFATHFHELTTLADAMPNEVCNLHAAVRSDGERVCMLYKMRVGAAEKSLGIAVARMSGFPESVLEIAKQRVRSLEAVTSGIGKFRPSTGAPELFTTGQSSPASANNNNNNSNGDAMTVDDSDIEEDF